MHTVLITDSDLGDPALESTWLTAALDVEVVIANCRTAEEVRQEVERVRPDAIITQWASIDASVIDAAAGRCRVISRYGIGVDNIDVGAAERAGIAVANVPHYCTEEVASHAVAAAMSLWRRLPQLDREVREGTWDAAAHAGDIGRLSHATVGLVGCGRIGLLVARAFEVWGARVLVVDPGPARDEYPRVSLAEVAREADIVSLHAPLLPETQHIIGENFFASAQRRPVVVNTSRGGLVDVAAAVRAVGSGRIRGLALDVFEREPLAVDDIVRSAPNTIITPHAAWCSDTALPDLRRGAVDNVIRALTAHSEGRAEG